jgi:hypothetical protein
MKTNVTMSIDIELILDLKKEGVDNLSLLVNNFLIAYLKGSEKADDKDIVIDGLKKKIKEADEKKLEEKMKREKERNEPEGKIVYSGRVPQRD